VGEKMASGQKHVRFINGIRKIVNYWGECIEKIDDYTEKF
jgi:hypothetical protein